MCGIFGAVSVAGRPLRHPGCLSAMAASLAHRGPDGERIVGHERARLGARRLAIMDLSTGDIETIVPFYERFGPAAVERLEGMFGLAIWDEARATLVLARDRAGEKPLFWTERDGELRFASEVQALLVYPDQP